MKKISKSDIQRRDKIASDLKDTREKLEHELAALEDLYRAYNDAKQEAKSYCDDIASQIEEYIGEKSEAWQGGENGQRWESWKEVYEGFDIELETKVPEFDEVDVAELLEQLPEEPE
jgi:chromosome segregation ATPase